MPYITREFKPYLSYSNLGYMLSHTHALPSAASVGPSVDYGEVQFLGFAPLARLSKNDIEFFEVETIFGGVTLN